MSHADMSAWGLPAPDPETTHEGDQAHPPTVKTRLPHLRPFAAAATTAAAATAANARRAAAVAGAR